MKLAYKKKAKRGQTPFNVFIADYFIAPEIVAVDLSGFTNQVGSTISALLPTTSGWQV